MAHKRKDTLARVQEWAKHLRPYGKRVQAKAERRAANKEIKRGLDWRWQHFKFCYTNFTVSVR
jgi:hypothetical protein